MPTPTPQWNTVIANCVQDGIPTLACVPALFRNLVNLALIFAGVVALFMILWGGIQYIRSGGDAKTLEGAQKTITYAVIGLILVLLSFTIIFLISYITQVTCINEFGFNNCK